MKYIVENIINSEEMYNIIDAINKIDSKKEIDDYLEENNISPNAIIDNIDYASRLSGWRLIYLINKSDLVKKHNRRSFNKLLMLSVRNANVKRALQNYLKKNYKYVANRLNKMPNLPPTQAELSECD